MNLAPKLLQSKQRRTTSVDTHQNRSLIFHKEIVDWIITKIASFGLFIFQIQWKKLNGLET